MSSPNNTIISHPGQFIVDISGNVWSIVDGQVAVNGVSDPTTRNVIEMAYEGGVVWQKNSDNLWWSKTAPGDSWGPPDGTSVDPIPNQLASANNSIVTLLGGAATGSITDASGNAWSISGGKVTLNGIADGTTANVIELAYVNGRIWQENSNHLWWSKAKPSDGWSSGDGTTVNPVRNVTRIWDGSYASFTAAGHWSPNGVPQSGDTAEIASGNVSVAPGSASGVNFLLHGGGVGFTSAGAYGIGTLNGSGMVQLGYPQQHVTVTTTGVSLSGGSLYVGEFLGTNSLLAIHGNTSLRDGATFTVALSGTASLPRGALENDGTMAVTASSLSVGSLTGHGTVVAKAHSTLNLAAASAGETIQLQSAHLYVGGLPAQGSTAMQFLAPVTNFGATSAITLINTVATTEVFARSSPTAGELFLYNGTQLVADMHISGQAHIYASTNTTGAPSVTLTSYDTGHSLPLASS
jgi:hypothetical protein